MLTVYKPGEAKVLLDGFCKALVLPSPKFQEYDVAPATGSLVKLNTRSSEVYDQLLFGVTAFEVMVTASIRSAVSHPLGLITYSFTLYVPLAG